MRSSLVDTEISLNTFKDVTVLPVLLLVKMMIDHTILVDRDI